MKGYDDYLQKEGERRTISEDAADTIGGSIITEDFDWEHMESLYLENPEAGAWYLTEHSLWNLERALELLQEVYEP